MQVRLYDSISALKNGKFHSFIKIQRASKPPLENPTKDKRLKNVCECVCTILIRLYTLT